MRIWSVSALLLCSALAAAIPARAQPLTCTWLGGAGDDNWSNAENWDCGAVPGSTDTAILNGGPTAILDAPFVVGALFMQAGSVGGGSNLDVLGFFSWTGGTLGGTGRIRVLDDAEISSSGLVLSGRTLLLENVTTVFGNFRGEGATEESRSGSDLAIGSGGRLEIGVEGSLESTEGSFSITPLGADGTVGVLGGLTVFGFSDLAIGVPVEAFGPISIGSNSSLTVSGGGFSNASLTSDGTFAVEGGEWVSGGPYFGSGGTVRAAGGTLRVNLLTARDGQEPEGALTFEPALEVDGGTVLFETSTSLQNPLTVLSGGTLGGRAFVFANGALANAGTVAPGPGLFPDAPAIFSFEPGNFAFPFDSSARLAVELAGTTPGSEHDQFAVTGNVTLDGTLNVSLIRGFEPALGQAFDVLTYESATGTFAECVGCDLGGGLQLVPSYGPTALTLTVEAVGPQTYTWTGAGEDALWTTPGNWSPEGVPGLEDTAVIASGPSVTVGTDVVVGQLDLSGGGLEGVSSLTVVNTLNWSGGTIGNAQGVTAEDEATLSGLLALDESRLRFEGAAVFNAADGGPRLEVSGSSVLDVGSGAVLVLDADDQQQLVIVDVDGPQTTANVTVESGGTLRKTGAGSALLTDLRASFDGAVEVVEGQLVPGASGSGTGSESTFAGSLTLADGTAVVLTLDGYTRLTASLDASGTGTVQLTQGVLEMDGVTAFTPLLDVAGGTARVLTPSEVQGDVLLRGAGVNRGTLTGSGDLTIGGELFWQEGAEINGDVEGLASVFANGGATIQPQLLPITGRRLHLGASSTLSVPDANSGLISFRGGAELVVAEEATLDLDIGVNGLLTLQDGGGVGASPVLRVGGLVNAVGPGTVTSGIDLVVTGALDVQQGTLEQGGSVVNLGIVGGSGLLDLSGTTQLTNSGEIGPGLGGVAVFTILPDAIAGFPFDGNGSLGIGLEGTGAGEEYDVLDVQGPVSLDGALRVLLLSGFQPSLGDQFEVLTYTERQGTFAECVGCDLGGGLQLVPSYGPTALTLTVEAVGPQTYTWTGAGEDALWTTPENWSPVGVPGSEDAARHLGTGQPAIDLNVNATVAEFLLQGDGELGGTGDLTITNDLTWSDSGQFTGSGLVVSEGAATIEPDFLLVNERQVVLAGQTLVITDGLDGDEIFVFTGGGNPASLTVGTGGSLDVEASAGDLVIDGNGATLEIDPGGVLRLESGEAVIQSIALLNDGVVEVNTGATLGLGLGTVSINAGEFFVEGGAGLVLTGGTHFWQGAAVTGSGAVRVIENALRLELGSVTQFEASLDVEVGQFVVGSGESNSQLQNTLTIGSAVLFDVSVQGTTPGTEYSQLAVDDAVDLAGTLRVSFGGYTPSVGETYSVLTYTGRTGIFDELDVGFIQGGLDVDTTYTPTALILTVFDPNAPTEYTWTGADPDDDDWTTPGNWSPVGVPGPADSAIIAEGPLAVLTTDQAVNNLTISDGGIAGTGNLVVGGALSWSGTGRIEGDRTVQVTGDGSQITPDVLALDAGALVFDGTVSFSGTLKAGNRLELSGGATVVLFAPATVDVPDGEMLEILDADGAGFEVLQVGPGETLSKTGAGEVLFSGVNVVNGGFVAIAEGRLAFGVGGQGAMRGDPARLGEGGGSYAVAAGAELAFVSGTFFLSGAVSLTGDGDVSIEGGVLTLDGVTVVTPSVAVTGGRLDIAQASAFQGDLAIADTGVLGGGGALTLAGDLAWSGQGRIEGANPVTVAGALTVDPDDVVLSGRRLGVRGATNAIVVDGKDADRIGFENGAVLEVAAGATLAADVPVGQTLRIEDLDGGGTTDRIVASGTVRKTGIGGLTVTVRFENDGALSVFGGGLDLRGGGVSNGGTSTEVLPGVALGLDGDHALFGAYVGDGDVLVLGGTVLFDPSPVARGGTGFDTDLIVLGGTVTIPNTVPLGGDLLWLDGTLNGGGVLIASNGVTVSHADGQPTLDATDLRFAGTATIEGGGPGSGSVDIVNGATVTVEAAATATLSGAQVFSDSDGGTFVNDGTLLVDTATDPITDLGADLLFANTGTLRALAGATLRVDGAANTGRIEGEGTVAPNDLARFSNTGVVAPGLNPGPGTLSAGGAGFSFETEAAFEVELGGTTPGTEHDQFLVPGAAELAGILAVALEDGYTPSVGDQYSVLLYEGRTGTFAECVGCDLGGGLTLVPTYTPTALVLMVEGDGGGVDYTWTGAGEDGLWSTPENWSPQGVPGPEDTARHLGTGQPPITLDVTATVAGFTLEGAGRLEGTNDLLVTGAFAWRDEGAFAGGGTVTAEGPATLDPDRLFLEGRAVVLAGQASLATDGDDADEVFINTGGTLSVGAGGALDLDAGAGPLLVGGNGGLLRVGDGGELRLLGGQVTSTIGFLNDGLTVVEADGFTLETSSTTGGTFDIGAGAELVLAGANHLLDGAVTGAGTVRMAASVLSLTLDAVTTFEAALDVETGQLVVVPSETNSQLQNTLSIGADALYDVRVEGSLPGTEYSQLAVADAVALDGTLRVAFGGYVPPVGESYTVLTYTERTGVFAALDVGFIPGGLTVEPTYTPTALVLTVVDPGGAVNYTWTGAGEDGLWSTPENWDPVGVPGPEDTATVGFGAPQLTAPVTVAALTLLVEGGLDLNGQALTISGDFTHTGRTVSGDGDVSVGGLFTWRSGPLLGDGTVTAAGGALLSGTALGLRDRALRLEGASVFGGEGANTRLFLSGADLVIAPEATLDIDDADGASVLFDPSAGGPSRVVNEGVLRVTGGLVVLGGFDDPLGVGLTLESSGVLDLASGTLRLTGGGTSTGAILVGGNLTLAAQTFSMTGFSLSGAGVLTVADGATADLVAGPLPVGRAADGVAARGGGVRYVNDGLTRKTGSGLWQMTGTDFEIENSGLFDVAEGVLSLENGRVASTGVFSGVGELRVAATTLFENAGAVAPGPEGAVGVLAVSDGFPLGAEGQLVIELGGLAPGDEHDQLAVLGEAVVDGTLAVRLVDGFVPALGDQFLIVPYETRTGTFAACDGCDLGGGLSLVPEYTPSGLVLAVEDEDVNQPPMANDDAAETDEDVPVLVDVLANDSDPDGDPLQLTAVGSPKSGTAEAAEGQVLYTPAPGFSGTDRFMYEIGDGRGGTNTAQVTVTVNPEVNQPPQANGDAAETDEGVPVLIDVLANDSDPDGDPLQLTAVGAPENGTAEAVDGQVLYTPASGFSGTDAFSYEIGDGRGGVGTAQVSVTVNPRTVVEVTVEDDVTVGGGASVEVFVAGFTPTTAEVRFRPGGATAYDAAPLTPEGEGYRAAIPAVTLRGIDYYVFLSDGETTVTVPAEDPENEPIHLQVAVGIVTTPAPPPPDGTYRMVSVPVDLDDPDPAAAFEDDYGPYDPADWRLLRWEPGPGRYAEFPDLGAALTPGTAFWLATREDAPFDVESGQSVDASAPVVLSLAPGWNQIGSPFAFPVAWADVGGTEGVGPPAGWDGAEYLLGETVLAPWAGYFVENRTGSAVAVTVPPSSADGSRGSAHAEATGYRLRLRAEAGPGYRDTQNLLGFDEAAAPGRDDLDLAEPPPPGEHIRLSFLDGETRLGHSLQPDGGAGAAWEAEVAATPGLLRDGPLAVRVALVEMAPPPEGYGRWVLDLARTAALPLDEADGPGSGATFEVVLTPQAPTRRLRVIIGTEAFAAQAAGGIPLVPLDDALLPAYPNPTRRTASVPYQLAERGPVTLAVYDLLGRRIALLVDGEQDGGRHEARWDASAAASGVYVYRLQVGDFSATGKLLILR